jgi:hypothetical protein
MHSYEHVTTKALPWSLQNYFFPFPDGKTTTSLPSLPPYRVVRAIRECACLLKIAGSNPSSGKESSFHSNLLLTCDRLQYVSVHCGCLFAVSLCSQIWLSRRYANPPILVLIYINLPLLFFISELWR